MSRCIHGCSWEAVRGRCLPWKDGQSQGVGGKPQAAPSPPTSSLIVQVMMETGLSLQQAVGITIFTCRQRLARLPSETCNFTVPRAHTCRENTSLTASSSRFPLSVPSSLRLAEFFLPTHTRETILSGSHAHRRFSRRYRKAGRTHPAQQQVEGGGTVCGSPLYPSHRRGSMNCLFKKWMEDGLHGPTCGPQAILLSF